VLFGEQNCPSAVQELPLVTLWPLAAHVHRTVSPTEILTVLGSNVSVPPGATVTSTIVLVADGTPLITGWPFWSTIRSGDALLVLGILARCSPASIRTRDPVPTRTDTQRINLPAFDIFMFLILFCAATFPGFPYFKTEMQLALCDFSAAIFAGAFKNRKQKASTVGTKK
jgi:hypothetical protein